MELFRTTEYYIFRQGEHSLWCSRKTGLLEPRTGNDSTSLVLESLTNFIGVHYITFHEL